MKAMSGRPALKMPGAEAWVTAAGVRVRYFRAGDGPPVILLHGLGESAVIWYSNIDSLARRLTVYAPDLPGHGASEKPDWDYTLAESVQFMEAFMDALGLERASFIGNSMGGLVALAMALERPNRVHRLILEDSAGLGRELAWFLRIMTAPMLGEILARNNRESTRWVLHRIFSARSFLTERFVDMLHRERGRPGNKAAMLKILRSGVGLRGLKRELNMTDRLGEVRAPALLVWGAEDSIFPVAHAHRAVKRLPNGKLRVFQGCGHWPHMEVNQAFNRLAAEFLG